MVNSNTFCAALFIQSMDSKALLVRSGITAACNNYARRRTGLDANLNPITQDKTYIRAGQSTVKTGNQRSFAVSGDRYVGDEFQDFALSHKIKYGTGQAVVRKYVYYNILTGTGEQGEVCIIVNSDGSGEAGNSAEIDIELKISGAAPTEFSYSALTA